MARSRARAASPPRSTARSKKAGDSGVEVVEESGGLDADDGMAIVSTIILIVALLLVDYQLGTTYDKGFFF